MSFTVVGSWPWQFMAFALTLSAFVFVSLEFGLKLTIVRHEKFFKSLILSAVF